MRFGSRFLRPLLGFVFLGFILWSWRRYRAGQTSLNVAVSTKFTTDSRNASQCTIHTCLNLRKCVTSGRDLKVYVQPLIDVFTEDGEQLSPKPSTEFLRIRRILSNSICATSNFRNACLIYPGIDTLSIGRFKNIKAAKLSIDTAASQFPNKPNMFVFSFFGSPAVFGDAIVISSNHLRSTFRPYYDIVSPPFLLSSHQFPPQRRPSRARILLPLPFGLNPNASPGFEASLRDYDPDTVKVLTQCFDSSFCIDGKEVEYPQCLETVVFVVISEHVVGFDVVLADALNAGAIPVVISDTILLPFDFDFIDWSKAAFTFSPTNIKFALSKLSAVDDGTIEEMRKFGKLIFTEYYGTLPRMVKSTMTLLENRLMVPRTALPKSVFSEPPEKAVCNNFVAVVTHHYDTDEIKLKWLLRFLLYTPTNASAIIVVTERNIRHIFTEFVVPSNPLPIRLATTNSIASTFSSTLTAYTSQCLLFVIDSDFPSSQLDESLLDTGFNIASNFHETVTLLTTGNQNKYPDCPYFTHVSAIRNHYPPLINHSHCVTHAVVTTGKPSTDNSLRWNSCALK
uniref:Exostosin domain-containing protein n=1 Tax=Panagrellus redivivus TaxID=6233 RepID=A0A7E4VBK7_PANRE